MAVNEDFRGECVLGFFRKCVSCVVEKKERLSQTVTEADCYYLLDKTIDL